MVESKLIIIAKHLPIKMVETSQVDSSEFFVVPEGTRTALSDAPKNENNQIELILDQKIEITHDTVHLSFKLHEADMVAGLFVGGCVRVFVPEEGGKWLARAYTPVSNLTKLGFVDFVIKVYRKSEEFPEGGKMSQRLDAL